MKNDKRFTVTQTEAELDFKDVYILPQYSEITSRKQVDTSVSLCNGRLNLKVPVVTANMDSVTESTMCIAVSRAGGIGALHRFMSIDDNVEQYNKVKRFSQDCFVSIGVNDESKDRAEALIKAGADKFVIDIAHGHSKMMKDMTVWLRSRLNETNPNAGIIMAGNVATWQGVKDLKEWGADIVKVGIGPGAVCLTKNVTGVTRPQFSAILECSKHNTIPVVADGGIKEIGDICKAIGAGASLVMSGRLFAGCFEAPGQRLSDGTKVYRGMASKEAMLTIRKDDGTLPTPEGKSDTVKEEGSAGLVVDHIKGGLQSAMSYSDAKTINEFQENVLFGVRFTSNT